MAQIAGDGAQVFAQVHEDVGPHVPDGMIAQLPDPGPQAYGRLLSGEHLEKAS